MVAWLTDVHFDHTSEANVSYLARKASEIEGTNAIVITGDISYSNRLHSHLQLFSDAASVPVYFVLGNHDFWGATITETRERAQEACNEDPHKRLCYLRNVPFVQITNSSCLIGVDGWYDAKAGDLNTPLLMNDFLEIDDLADEMSLGSVPNWTKGASRVGLHQKLAAIAFAETEFLESKIFAAIKSGLKRIWIATHVPPFVESVWYQGANMPNPYYTNVCMGVLLRKMAQKYPTIHFNVLCGHTHTANTYRPYSNLVVRTGESRYASPKVQQWFDFDQQ